MFEVNNNVVVRNDVDDSFSFVASSNNVITNNVGSNNTGGMFLITFQGLGSNNNQVSANTNSNNQGGSGLVILEGSVGNTISGNKSFDNTVFDMEDDNPNCGSNRWQGNHFNTASQPCIH